MPDCQLCGRSDLPVTASSNDSEKRKTRSSVSKSNTERTQWIDCDHCKKWMHPFCCGLTTEDLQVIIDKKSFFKCICCCLGQLGKV